MRIAKWLGVLFLWLGALAMVGALIITRVVDPESFKPRIADAVRTATGQTLSLRGPLRLSWFPWLAVESNAGALANPLDPVGTPLVSWRKARIGARLWPLLRGELVLDQLQLDGLHVQLTRDAGGHGNWLSLLDGLRRPGRTGGTSFKELRGLLLRDSSIEYRDASGFKWSLSGWHVDSGAIHPNQPFAFDSQFELTTGEQGPRQSMALHAVLRLGAGSLDIADVAASLRLRAAGLRSDGVPMTLKAALVHADLPAQTWSAPVATLQSATASLNFRAAQLQLGNPSAEAHANVELPLTSLRKLLADWGVKVPHTRDPAALERFAFVCKISYGAFGVAADITALQLDDSHFSGRVARGTADGPIEFQLQGDTMRLDRYRSPANEHATPFVFPTAQLAALRARGTLTLEQAQAAGAEFRGVTLRLLLAEGALSTTP